MSVALLQVVHLLCEYLVLLDCLIVADELGPLVEDRIAAFGERLERAEQLARIDAARRQLVHLARLGQKMADTKRIAMMEEVLDVVDLLHLHECRPIADRVGGDQVEQKARMAAEYVVDEDLPLAFAEHLGEYCLEQRPAVHL